MSRQVTYPQTYESDFHAPVMAHEVVALLQNAQHVLDCTLGGGGHSLALLERGSRVSAIDRDPEAIEASAVRLAEYQTTGRFRAVLANYADLEHEPSLGAQAFDGILVDLGVSSHQIDDATRGFSFRPGAVLDMRMGVGAQGDAGSFLNESGEQVLASVFREYADEHRALRLAREIVRRRERRPFATSDDLVGAIRGALGASSGPADFARLFQAVRIAVNDELDGLARALPVLRDHLAPGGTFVVIAYHSGEDRLVKNAFRDWSARCICPPRHPICICRGRPLGETLTKRPLSASEVETLRNPRARSARLRAWRNAA